MPDGPAPAPRTATTRDASALASRAGPMTAATPATGLIAGSRVVATLVLGLRARLIAAAAPKSAPQATGALALGVPALASLAGSIRSFSRDAAAR